MKTEILSSKLIAPSSPTSPHLQKSPISCLEQLALSVYVPRIFFYQAEGEEHGVSDIEEESKQLQKSLSEILTLFYPLGGRYIKDDASIHCNDKGAEYLEVKVNSNLSQFLERKEHHETELLNQLVNLPSESDDTPLVTVQFNMFKCGGVAIGMGVSHRILDAFSAFGFINAFATACRMGVDKVGYRPTFQLASLCPPRDMTGPTPRVPAQENQFKSSNVVMKRFVFSGAAISKLKAAVSAGLRGSELLKRQPTRVEVVIGLIWLALIKVAKARCGHWRPSILRFPVNIRGKTTLPVPENSFGNFIGPVFAKFTPNAENNVQLHELVVQVRDGLSRTIADIANASSGDDLALMLCNAIKEESEARENSEVDLFHFTSWCRFPMYEADFGWGKPTWVTTAISSKKRISTLMDTKDGDGIEAWISLDENNMLLFEQDPDIITFTAR
ncbi:unnamed protein product [Dovyalis caffra]|uniref:Uncharacterized protein n=1 Tax=Dovyalis caffra TaxID=77055 RepID=A0AAV1QM89_9ROSI|nr:unnamed protein product [Dovyalis caffra]